MKKNHNFPILATLALMFLLASCSEQETIRPQKKNIDDAVFASGHVEQENNYTASAKADGIILSLPLKEGDRVLKNDLIARIENDVQDNQLQDAVVVYEDARFNASPNSPQLQQLASQIDQAEKQVAFDKDNYLRYKGLYEKKSVSKLDYEKTELQYEAAQSKLEELKKSYEDAQRSLQLNSHRSAVQVSTQQSKLGDYRLISESTGTLIQVFKKQGELVRRGEPVVQISSGDYLIKLFVAEEDITKIDLGQYVAVNVNTYPNKVFSATISKIYPAFDEVEQSYVVEAQFEELPEKMFSGTQLQANIQTNSRKDVLVIPTAYLAKGRFVTLANGEEIQIETGSKSQAWTEVVSGITENDLIIKPNN